MNMNYQKGLQHFHTMMENENSDELTKQSIMMMNKQYLQIIDSVNANIKELENEYMDLKWEIRQQDQKISQLQDKVKRLKENQEIINGFVDCQLNENGMSRQMLWGWNKSNNNSGMNKSMNKKKKTVSEYLIGLLKDDEVELSELEMEQIWGLVKNMREKGE